MSRYRSHLFSRAWRELSDPDALFFLALSPPAAMIGRCFGVVGPGRRARRSPGGARHRRWAGDHELGVETGFPSENATTQGSIALEAKRIVPAPATRERILGWGRRPAVNSGSGCLGSSADRPLATARPGRSAPPARRSIA